MRQQETATAYLQSKHQGAKFLGISEASLMRAVRRGEIAYVRVGNLVKFRPEDLAAYVNARRVNGRAA